MHKKRQLQYTTAAGVRLKVPNKRACTFHFLDIKKNWKRRKKSEELKNWKLGQNWKIGQHQNCKSDKIEIVSNWKFAKFGQH